MGLDLDIESLTGPGRRPAPVQAHVERDLTEADLALLAQGGSIEAPPLKRLTERHHGLARLLASGVKEGVAGALLGYSGSRVSILKSSPAFRELLELYRSEQDAVFLSTAEQLAGLSKDAILLLRERLEDEPEKLTTGALMELVKLTADRTGFGPKSTQDVNVNVNLADRLEAARARARQALLPQGEVIEGKVVEDE